MTIRLSNLFLVLALLIASVALAFGAKQAYATSHFIQPANCPYDPGPGVAGNCTKDSQCTAQCASIGLPGGGWCTFWPQYGRKCCGCRA
jgi:hypothetical protein